MITDILQHGFENHHLVWVQITPGIKDLCRWKHVRRTFGDSLVRIFRAAGQCRCEAGLLRNFDWKAEISRSASPFMVAIQPEVRKSKLDLGVELQSIVEYETYLENCSE